VDWVVVAGVVRYVRSSTGRRLAAVMSPPRALLSLSLPTQILDLKIYLLLMLLATLYAMFFFDLYIVVGIDAKWDAAVHAMNAVIFTLFFVDLTVRTAR
jgi:hypothetical protein